MAPAPLCSQLLEDSLSHASSFLVHVSVPPLNQFSSRLFWRNWGLEKSCCCRRPYIFGFAQSPEAFNGWGLRTEEAVLHFSTKWMFCSLNHVVALRMKWQLAMSAQKWISELSLLFWLLLYLKLIWRCLDFVLLAPTQMVVSGCFVRKAYTSFITFGFDIFPGRPGIAEYSTALRSTYLALQSVFYHVQLFEFLLP